MKRLTASKVDIAIGTRFGRAVTASEPYLKEFGNKTYGKANKRKRRTFVDLQCDCGKFSTVNTTDLLSGIRRSCGCDKGYIKRGKEHYNWKDGIKLNCGYVMLSFPEHPRADRGGYVLEHILVMEKEIGRSLRKSENVHHKNGIRSDNRPENLELWSTNQPCGQRVDDKTVWAIEWLLEYSPDLFSEETLKIFGKV